MRDRRSLRAGLAGPDLAVVLGSGLAEAADRFGEAASASYARIGGMGMPTVAGHPGIVSTRLVSGTEVLFFAGRRHLYEGDGSPAGIVELAAELGCRRIVLTQAAGSLSRALPIGSWFVPHGILPLPLRRFSGEATGGPPRGGALLSPALVRIVEESVVEAGLPVHTGTLCWTVGPAYETAAEGRAAAWAGASAATMSTFPELCAAHRTGMHAACLALITNHTANVSPGGTHHEEVLDMGRRGAEQLAIILGRLVAVLGRSGTEYA